MAANPHLKAVKRLMKEFSDLQKSPTEDFIAAPSEASVFEWHFTMRGAEDSVFQGGLYHGRILLPTDYPLKPPDIVMLTPSGRFETGIKVCLSNTSYHPENWQPTWTIRAILTALRVFFRTPAAGAIGGLDTPDPERRRYARLSHAWTCSGCQRPNRELLSPQAFPNSGGEAGSQPGSPRLAGADAAGQQQQMAQPPGGAQVSDGRQVGGLSAWERQEQELVRRRRAGGQGMQPLTLLGEDGDAGGDGGDGGGGDDGVVWPASPPRAVDHQRQHGDDGEEDGDGHQPGMVAQPKIEQPQSPQRKPQSPEQQKQQSPQQQQSQKEQQPQLRQREQAAAAAAPPQPQQPQLLQQQLQPQQQLQQQQQQRMPVAPVQPRPPQPQPQAVQLRQPLTTQSLLHVAALMLGIMLLLGLKVYRLVLQEGVGLGTRGGGGGGGPEGEQGGGG